MDTIDEIKKLKVLLDQGAITEEEYIYLKKKVLSEKLDTQKSENFIPPSLPEDSDKNHEKGNKPPSSIKTKKRIGCLGIIIIVVFIIYMIGLFSKKDDSNSNTISNESNSNTEKSEEQMIAKNLLTNNVYYDNTADGNYSLTFISLAGKGYSGAVNLDMITCISEYNYELNGNNIHLQFLGSTCNFSQASSLDLTYNSDNTISLILNGNLYVFKQE